MSDHMESIPAWMREALSDRMDRCAEDWGFQNNENEDGNLVFKQGTRLTENRLLLSEEENSTLCKMAEEMELSTHGVLKQGLRVLQMYRAGKLAPVLDDIGGCGVCE